MGEGAERLSVSVFDVTFLFNAYGLCGTVCLGRYVMGDGWDGVGGGDMILYAYIERNKEKNTKERKKERKK